MKIKLLLVTLFLITCNTIFAQQQIASIDTINLDTNHIEGRWVEENIKGEKTIYIFRDDMTFHKASDTGELLIFDTAGRFRLSNDTISVFYQNLSSKSINTKATRVKKMNFHVMSLSDDEINANLTQSNFTRFIRLKRQQAK